MFPKTTDPDATGHSHDFVFGAIVRQLGHNLHISIHPTNPNIIYLGEVNLWKNTTGGGTFDPLRLPR
jgi:hypothetical protein